MRILFTIAVLSISLSCNYQNSKKDITTENSKSGKTDSSTAEIKQKAVSDTVPADSSKESKKGESYSDWKSFWNAFKDVASKKDTSRLLTLVNYPFLYSADTVNKAEFKDYYFSELKGIQNALEPIVSDPDVLQGSNKVPPIDSVRYTRFKHTDYYFGRVNGYYKLVEIITPG